jgi:hypothetical protein
MLTNIFIYIRKCEIQIRNKQKENDIFIIKGYNKMENIKRKEQRTKKKIELSK